MTDLFAVMDEPRRPWLDPATVKSKFLKLTSSLHPDRVHGSADSQQKEAQERFTELNTACQCLQEPRHRLRHLLELETGAPPSQVEEIPSALVNSFFEIAALCREADHFIAKKAATISPLLRVELFEQEQHWAERLKALQKKLSERRETLLRRIEALDAEWVKNQLSGGPQPEGLLSELEEIYRVLGYLHRWSGQAQERLVQLSM